MLELRHAITALSEPIENTGVGMGAKRYPDRDLARHEEFLEPIEVFLADRAAHADPYSL